MPTKGQTPYKLFEDTRVSKTALVPALRTLNLMGETEEEPHTRIYMVQTAVRSIPVKKGKAAECMDIAKEAVLD